MSACVETMMYVREVPWHGLGTRVEKAPTSAEALSIAGLDWNVVQRPVKTDDGILIPNYVANVRDTDNRVLGVVTKKYKVVNNKDAFAFTDAIVGGNVRYETCGSLRDGKTVWMLAKLPENTVAGDEFFPYLLFTNSHDGTGAVRTAVVATRVVCQNTLNIALAGAKRSWSMKHMGNIEDKIEEAKMCLGLADNYMSELDKMANIYANTVITEDQLRDLMSELFPVFPDMSDREKKNVENLKHEFMITMYMPDLKKFQGSAWQFINAASDFATHTQPQRLTKNYKENNWGRVMNGHPIIDGAVTAVNRLMAKV